MCPNGEEADCKSVTYVNAGSNPVIHRKEIESKRKKMYILLYIIPIINLLLCNRKLCLNKLTI